MICSHGVPVPTRLRVPGVEASALALTLPQGPTRALILSMSFAVVLFSIVVQGLSFPWVARIAARRAPEQLTADPRPD